MSKKLVFINILIIRKNIYFYTPCMNQKHIYQPSEGEDANRLCEELTELIHKNPDFLKKVPSDFFDKIAEILWKMRL